MIQKIFISLDPEINDIVVKLKDVLKINKRSVTKDKIYLFQADTENVNVLAVPALSFSKINESLLSNGVDLNLDSEIYLLNGDCILPFFNDAYSKIKKVFKKCNPVFNYVQISETDEREIISPDSVSYEYIKKAGFKTFFVIPVSDLASNPYNLIYIADLLYELALGEKQLVADEDRFSVYTANETRLLYPLVMIGDLIACKRIGSGIEKYWSDIDSEIRNNSRLTNKKTDKYRKLFYEIYAKRIESPNTCDGFYEPIKIDCKNKAISVSANKEISYVYSDKLDDFTAMLKGYIANEINVALSEGGELLRAGRKRTEENRKKAVEGFIEKTAEKMVALILPTSYDYVNPRNELSVYGLLSNIDELELRTYVNPISARALLYGLTVRLKLLKKAKRAEDSLRTEFETRLTDRFVDLFLPKLNRYISLIEAFTDVSSIKKELDAISEKIRNTRDDLRNNYIGISKEFIDYLTANITPEPDVKDFLGNSVMGVLVAAFCKQEEPDNEKNIVLKNVRLSTEIKGKITDPYRKQLVKKNQTIMDYPVSAAIRTVIKAENPRITKKRLNGEIDKTLWKCFDNVMTNMDPSRVKLFSFCAKAAETADSEIFGVISRETDNSIKQFCNQNELKVIAIEKLL